MNMAGFDAVSVAGFVPRPAAKENAARALL